MCSSLVLEDSDDPISKYYESVICNGKFTRETVHAEPAANLLGGYQSRGVSTFHTVIFPVSLSTRIIPVCQLVVCFLLLGGYNVYKCIRCSQSLVLLRLSGFRDGEQKFSVLWTEAGKHVQRFNEANEDLSVFLCSV